MLAHTHFLVITKNQYHTKQSEVSADENELQIFGVLKKMCKMRR